jgi:hypothetical protein
MLSSPAADSKWIGEAASRRGEEKLATIVAYVNVVTVSKAGGWINPRRCIAVSYSNKCFMTR